MPKKIVGPIFSIGLTQRQKLFNKIPKNVRLFIGIGDLQASLYSILCDGEAGIILIFNFFEKF